jgi:hypothetical protein
MEVLAILLIFVSLTCLGGFIWALLSYSKLLKKLNSEERQLNKHYLKKAKQEASTIVETAGEEALEMLSDSRLISNKDQQLIDEVVTKISQQQSAFLQNAIDQMMSEFRTELQQLKNNNISMLSNVSKDIEKDTSSQLSEYTKAIEQETVKSEQTLDKQVKEEYQEIQNEIASYKQEQFKKIDNKIKDTFKQISVDILGKSISPDDHRDLILQTLEKAKNEKVFTN